MTGQGIQDSKDVQDMVDIEAFLLANIEGSGSESDNSAEIVTSIPK